MHADADRIPHAVESRDPRFDGWYVVGVLRDRIYCRPSCPERPSSGIHRYPTAAAAQQDGLRACPRCRPDAAPGSPEWSIRDDVVARAMRLIADGTVDREGVAGLADRTGHTVDALDRLLRSEVGADSPALAAAQRVRTARLLIDATELPFDDVATAAGYAGARRLTEAVREAYGADPAALRCDAHRRPGPPPNPAASSTTVSLRLPVRGPFAYRGAFGHLGAGAVPGCEEVRDGAFRRTLRLPHGAGIVSLTPAADHVACRLTLDDLRDLAPAITRCRALVDLDADPQEIVDALGRDPLLRPVVARAPGQRIPRTVDAGELAIRAVLGQQVSTKAARTHTQRLVSSYGRPITDDDGALTHTFPSPEDLAGIDPTTLALPRARRQSLTVLIRQLADGRLTLDAGCDWQRARAQLLALPGIGPWTAELVAMRGLGDPDAFPATDLGVRAAATALGIPEGPKALIEYSARWRPWRAYATQHLWTTLHHAVNDWPSKEFA